ncbi:MAG TPA: urea ABC transporter permease subunit UrtC [Rhodopila sp.]|jgi:urea transport system permease protein|nr:urea ABC transporter permease subunit UrtC [Rhodopila sp.]
MTFLNRKDVFGILIFALLVLVVLPLCLDPFRLNLVGKYLTYGFVALGLVLCWGDAGILSLGQGIFFGLGGYCMAMYLKLEASTPAATKIQSTPGIPDFMDWNQLTHLPWFWEPFHSLAFTIVAVPLVPMLLALVIGVAMFKRRVGGTYFAIITQAVASILTILIIGQQGYTGGVNGITDLRTLHGWDIRPDHAKTVLYFVSAFLLIVCVLLAQFVRRSKLGRILVAMRDKEDRVRFSGYDVANFKIFVFCFAAGLAAIGGAMFTLQVGFMSPSFVGIVPSIEMVIFCAVGGRTSILGAIYGALVINWARTTFSEELPQAWLFAMGALFILVVVAFPNGLAGIYRKYLDPLVDRVLPAGRRRTPPVQSAPTPATAAE